MKSADRQFEKLVLPLRLDDLRLQEILILLKGLSAGLPVLDFFILLLLLVLHLDLVLINLADRLLQIKDDLVFECAI